MFPGAGEAVEGGAVAVAVVDQAVVQAGGVQRLGARRRPGVARSAGASGGAAGVRVPVACRVQLSVGRLGVDGDRRRPSSSGPVTVT